MSHSSHCVVFCSFAVIMLRLIAIVITSDYHRCTTWSSTYYVFSVGDLPREVCGPHHSCLSSLVARPRADRLQGRCADIHSFTQKCTLDHSFLLPICPADGHHICYGSTSRLLVSSARRSTVGDRTFMVDGPRVWNTLMATSPSLSTFCQ